MGVADDSKKLNDLQQECMTKATDYETSQHSRSEELAALDKAKSILEEKTGGAASRAYSFIQLQADRDGSKMLSLLAQRIQSAALMGADPFAKVKGMIQEMIEKLVAEA